MAEGTSHQARVESALEAAEDLELAVRHTAEALGDDGAQPHLIAALTKFEAAIRAERLRLATRAAGAPISDQQSLAV
jgi:hypothetical protein